MCRAPLPSPAITGRPRAYCGSVCRGAAYRRRLRQGPPASNRWGTPPALFAELSAQWGPFGLDAAADSGNHLSERWLGPGSLLAEDALTYASWSHLSDGQAVWLNPPYSPSRQLPHWLVVAAATARDGVRVVTLIPAAPTAGWWRQGVDAHEGQVTYLPGRLTFVRDGVATPAMYGSAVVVFER